MRLNLNTEAVEALQRLYGRFKKENEYVGKLNGGFVCQLVHSLEKRLNSELVATISKDLTCKKVREKQVRERALKLVDHLDEDALNKLERRIKKAEMRIKETLEIGGNSAENQ